MGSERQLSRSTSEANNNGYLAIDLTRFTAGKSIALASNKDQTMSNYRHGQKTRFSTDPKDHADDRAGMRSASTAREERIAIALETIADDLSAIRAWLHKIEGKLK